jgi:hypothetical protein
MRYGPILGMIPIHMGNNPLQEWDMEMVSMKVEAIMEMEIWRSLSPSGMKDLIGLSDEQVNRLRPPEMEYRKAVIQNEADLRVAMVDLGTLMDARQTDMEAITGKVDESACCKKHDDVSCRGPSLRQKGIVSGAV